MATQVSLNSGAVSSAGSLKLQTNGTTDAVTIDTAQNLGLGVTPSAWNSGWKAFQFGAVGAAWSNAGNSMWTANEYLNLSGNEIYLTSQYVLKYRQDVGSGVHSWHTAPSGTAGNPITFTQAMTLDASGRLLVGLTSSIASNGIAQIGGNADTRLIVDGSSTQGIYFTKSGADNGTFRVDSSGNYNWFVKGAGTANMTLDSSGNLLVGRTDAAAGNLGGKIASTGFIEAVVNNAECFSANRKNGTGTLMLLQYQNSTKGSISTDGTNVAYNTSSDYRLKENVVDLTNALLTVSQLKPRQFDWKETQVTTTGFIAHELAEVMPHAVTGEKDAVDQDGNPVYQGIDTSFLVATLTAAIQEQQTLIQDQLALINSLTARVESLENK